MCIYIYGAQCVLEERRETKAEGVERERGVREHKEGERKGDRIKTTIR